MASRRNYLTQAELAEFADITITDSAEADDQISMAEELIDAYVGRQEKFYCSELKGLAQAGASTSITLQSNQQNLYDIDYFKWCEVEIIGGTGIGQRQVCISSTANGVLSFASAWTTNPDSTSFYKIYQLGKFPRKQDVHFYAETPPSTYYKSIPEAVKRATAAQLEYRIYMGDNLFRTDETDKIRERIGDYEYENAVAGAGSVGTAKLIAPKARLLLRGIRNITGEIIV